MHKKKTPQMKSKLKSSITPIKEYTYEKTNIKSQSRTIINSHKLQITIKTKTLDHDHHHHQHHKNNYIIKQTYVELEGPKSGFSLRG
ncbi:hypothetical protein HanRHA438_Chr02g0083741 [Helianthus annuus]|nr:hypothetical protein HanRHA438_Chr02g0083741 [Helianthus annuus]